MTTAEKKSDKNNYNQNNYNNNDSACNSLWTLGRNTSILSLGDSQYLERGMSKTYCERPLKGNGILGA